MPVKGFLALVKTSSGCDKSSFLSDLGVGSFVLTTLAFQAKLRSMLARYPAQPESMFLVHHVKAGPNALRPSNPYSHDRSGMDRAGTS